jgi:3-methyladenine DNA glycosylase AlkD
MESMMTQTEEVKEIISRLKSLESPSDIEGMAHYGINTHKAFGISIYTLRKIAKEIGNDHSLAEDLWKTGFHEARILASYIDRPEWVIEEQMEKWVSDFDSWDVCDQVCDLFDRTRFAYQKAIEWSKRPEEFVKRAAFALIAGLSVHDKEAADEKLAQFFPIIVRESVDDRNFVKKAVNWALRNIGKRNRILNRMAIDTARTISNIDNRTARWIASDALRELTSEKIERKLSKQSVHSHKV